MRPTIIGAVIIAFVAVFYFTELSTSLSGAASSVANATPTQTPSADPLLRDVYNAVDWFRYVAGRFLTYGIGIVIIIAVIVELLSSAKE